MATSRPASQHASGGSTGAGVYVLSLCCVRPFLCVCLVQGYGEVAIPPEPAPSVSSSSSSASAGSADAEAGTLAMATPSTAGMAAAPESDAAAIQAAVALAGPASTNGSTSSSNGRSSGTHLAGEVPGLAAARRLLQYSQGSCPFPAGPLPLTPAEIGSDGSMFSAYFHEAIANCIFWGLFKSGALRTTVKDGNIPQLRLITDLFGGLIPELPKHFSKKGMLLQIDMIEAPMVGVGRWCMMLGCASQQLRCRDMFVQADLWCVFLVGRTID